MDMSTARHAFITGGASGIGLGIADALLKRGISVTITDVDEDGLEAVVAARPGARGQVLDVRDRAAWSIAKAQAEAAFGPVDILVANAGIGPDGELLADARPESFDLIMAINVGGVFNAISAFAGDMRARGSGHIVITASVTGLVTGQVPRIGTYTASKFAIVALGEGLRTEMAPHGVGVSTLCPGLVTSNLGRNSTRLGMPARKAQRETGGGAGAAHVGMDPAEVGEITIDGIARDLPYIITHPEGWPEVEARWRALAGAFSVAEPSR
jgi:NAD(P)-dependent dehydrogenase (short-subunit alcohol dehydrogenase family)